MAKRKSTGIKLRFDVFKRDKFICQYCGRTPPEVLLQADHIIPVAAGGPTEFNNLVTSCEACNQGKRDGLLADVPETVRENIERAREVAEQCKAYNVLLMNLRTKENEAITRLGKYWSNLNGRPKDKYVFTTACTPSIRTFLKHLPEAEILDAIDIAFSRRPPATSGNDHATWKYFCGVCWTKVRGPKP